MSKAKLREGRSATYFLIFVTDYRIQVFGKLTIDIHSVADNSLPCILLS